MRNAECGENIIYQVAEGLMKEKANLNEKRQFESDGKSSFDGIVGDDGTDGDADAAKVVDLYFSRYFNRLETLAKK